MKVSVVIPMYNASKTILNCLHALAQQERKPDEVIVVDNNSTDLSKLIVTNAISALNGINVIVCDQFKVGPGPARNKGVEVAGGDIIAFTDTDCIPDKYWIKGILETFTQNKDLDAAGGIEKTLVAPATVMGKFLSAFWLTSDELIQSSLHRKEDFFDGKFIVTFNCAFKREFFIRIGGFDESFNTGEDLDITLRAIEAGGNLIVWNNNMVVCHRQDISFKGLLKREFQYGKGLVRVVHRHFQNNTFVMVPHGHFQWPNKIGLTVVLMTNIPKSVFLLTVLLLTLCFSHLLFCFMFALAIIYFFLKIRRLVRNSGLNLTIRETIIAFGYYLGREISELVSRIYWSVKYKIICL